MRHIGHLPGGQARVFSDFLVSRGISNAVEREQDGTYAIWIHEEDDLARAQDYLGGFSANPEAAEYQDAGQAAEEARERQRKDNEAYRKRVRSRRSLFTSFGTYGVGLLTYSLITVCVIVSLYTRFGSNEEAYLPLLISDPLVGGPGMPEVFSGQVWRLITPILLHFGPIHILFNMMWLYQLGSMIEARRGTFNLLLLVVGIGVASNVAQLLVTGWPRFGGMSGVVYGLAGYVWIQGKLNRESGLFLDGHSMTILLIWLVVCYTGWMGPVANTAHLVGFLAGLAWGGLSAWAETRSGRA
ncbi:MAG TPA: rhomboid family intramembrane serine protease [Verrucomicrobiae bacterium]|nr:rhomboid family intramembrane serine protease [Verrucomicrobiae bacterium]